MANSFITDEMEEYVIAIHRKTADIYLYPFDADVAMTGAKVVTRKGKTVHAVQKVLDEKTNTFFITGVYSGKRLKWDIAGRFKSPYANSPFDLYIPERYFDPEWKEKCQMTNAEWNAKFARPHTAKPEYPEIIDYDKYISENEAQ